MDQAFWAGIICARSSGKGLCRLTARWQRLSSRNCLSLGRTPMVLRVMRLGLQARPQGAVSTSMARFTFSQLSSGSPMPMNTALVSSPASSIAKNWFRISAADRFPWKPWRPVMQNWQFILQPAWELTQSVLRSSSGIITASMPEPSPKGKRYFRVPSREVWTSTGATSPTSYFSMSASLPALERLVICPISPTRF